MFTSDSDIQKLARSVRLFVRDTVHRSRKDRAPALASSAAQDQVHHVDHHADGGPVLLAHNKERQELVCGRACEKGADFNKVTTDTGTTPLIIIVLPRRAHHRHCETAYRRRRRRQGEDRRRGDSAVDRRCLSTMDVAVSRSASRKRRRREYLRRRRRRMQPALHRLPEGQRAVRLGPPRAQRFRWRRLRVVRARAHTKNK